MKKYVFGMLFILMLTLSFSAYAQWGKGHGRYNGRYNSRYYSHHRYPSRPSVSIIGSLPFGAISLSFGNRYYHYHNGYYYRPYNRGYMIVQPPIGIIVPSLPLGYTRIIIGSHPYYRYGDVFYSPYDNRYKVVERPNEDEEISSGDDNAPGQPASEYEKVVLEGKTYYKKGDKYYKALVDKKGEIVYEEIGEKIKSE